MSDFTAKDVQSLRKSSGAGMMDAKRALTDASGDAESAMQLLRERGLAKTLKRADNENNEGIIVVASDDSATALVQLKCETDFCAKSEDFKLLADKLVIAVCMDGSKAVKTFSDEIDGLKLKLKENIEVGDVVRYASYKNGEHPVIDSYVHGDGKAAVLIEANGVDPETLHEIALHIAFADPQYLSREDVPAELVEKETAALLEITKSEGKPEKVWEMITKGRVNSWHSGIVLLEQGVLGEKIKVSERIGDGTIIRFTHSKLG